MKVPEGSTGTTAATREGGVPGARGTYHRPGVAVALVDHLHQRPSDVQGVQLLHLLPLFPPAEELLNAGNS